MNSWLNVKEAAHFLRCSKSTIYRLCRSHALSFTKKGIGLRIRAQDLEAWLNEGKREARAANFLLTSCLPINIKSGGRQRMAKVRRLTFVQNGEFLSGTVYQRKTKRGRRWCINFQVNGKRIRKVAHLAQAEEEALVALSQEMRKAFDREYGVVRKGKKIKFKDFAEIYLETYAKVRKRSWREDEKYLKAQLIPFFGKSELREITPLSVDQFIAQRQKDGVKNSTINRELTVLKKMLNLAIDWQFEIEKNPVKRARYFSEERYKRDRVLSCEEENALFREAVPHLKPILTCALQTGMRVGEILSLKWENVSLEKRQILIKAESSKSGRARIIPINSTLLHELEKLKRENKNEFVFLYESRPLKSIAHAFAGARRRAEIKDLTFHDLRHTVATRLASRGANPVTVKNILGHSNLRTTEIYLHSNLKQIREEIELLDEAPKVPSPMRHRIRKKLATLPFSMN